MSVRFGHSVVWRIIFKVFKVTFFVVVFCVILYYYFWIYFDCIIFEFSLNLFPLRPKIDYKSYVYTVCHLGLLHALGLTFPLNFIQYKSENCSCCFLVFTLFMFSWSRLLLPFRFSSFICCGCCLEEEDELCIYPEVRRMGASTFRLGRVRPV